MDLRVEPQADRDPTDPRGADQARSVIDEAGGTAQPFALLGFELRRVTRPNTRIVGEIEEVVLNRCILAGVEVLTAGGAEIDVAGTPRRPVVEGRFDGDDAPERAARAAIEILAVTRRNQRATENEFQIVGALTVGTAATAPNGARVVSGGAEVLLGRLRERAAPGQILLSADAKKATRKVVETIPARLPAQGHQGSAASAFVLRGLK
jgi:hypothetical protein